MSDGALLSTGDWTIREQEHRRRADALLDTYRPADGKPHPVWDFLFTYYSLRPGQLRTWHPGYGVVLAGAQRYLDRTGYVQVDGGVAVSRQYLSTRTDTVRFVHGLLRATASRPARLNCFGLHEWAMVYRAPTVRHAQVPLRLGAAGTNAVVESMPLRCSHFDAFRFFTEPATRRNEGRPTRTDQVGWEQPGCLHTNMDLYKFAYKLGPLVESSLILDCLELAADARALDMRASPYDLRVYGFVPIEIETAAGRAEYVRAQQEIASRAAPLRTALTARCGELLSAAKAVVRGE
ncbi:3-methyladenine DNA glycosylase [Mycobacterium sp. CPCC 205710]|uniref:3-methyladenine DNA glycosylase n=1 Tax=Mycobacterium deserti TaxID=2978347 RepID=A0ABT2MJ09_9MYCO|nr:3-methyladenine DNA glycosylase [Mycobacterium deserti]MCT7661976.1 3-methyladenine DNA glycosylase [Mycobacterium deserti]